MEKKPLEEDDEEEKAKIAAMNEEEKIKAYMKGSYMVFLALYVIQPHYPKCPSELCASRFHGRNSFRVPAARRYASKSNESYQSGNKSGDAEIEVRHGCGKQSGTETPP